MLPFMRKLGLEDRGGGAHREEWRAASPRPASSAPNGNLQPHSLRQVRVVDNCPKGKGTRIFLCPATQNFSHRHLNQRPPLHRR